MRQRRFTGGRAVRANYSRRSGCNVYKTAEPPSRSLSLLEDRRWKLDAVDLADGHELAVAFRGRPGLTSLHVGSTPSSAGGRRQFASNVGYTRHSAAGRREVEG